MKSLRKILMAGVMLAMSALVFTACSDDDNGKTPLEILQSTQWISETTYGGGDLQLKSIIDIGYSQAGGLGTGVIFVNGGLLADKIKPMTIEEGDFGDGYTIKVKSEAISDVPEQAVMYVKVLNEGSISVKLANGQEEIYIASSQKYDLTKTSPGILG